VSEFILHITNGAITNPKVVREKFTLKDGKYLVSIKSIKKRSLQQNAYYHGVVVPMVKEGLREAGYNEVRTNEDAHEILKHLFLKKKITSEKSGEEITIAGSTAKLKTVEFNQFLEDIWQWAATYLNISIPEPNEQMIMFAQYDRESKTIIIE
jgi:RNA-binding protein YhbY